MFRLFFGNVLCHHNKYLMGYLEFLHSSRIIYLPSVKYFRKNSISSKSLKRKRLIIVFIFVNTIQYAHNLESNIFLNKLGPPPFFHSDTNLVLGHVLVHSDWIVNTPLICNFILPRRECAVQEFCPRAFTKLLLSLLAQSLRNGFDIWLSYV